MKKTIKKLKPRFIDEPKRRVVRKAVAPEKPEKAVAAAEDACEAEGCQNPKAPTQPAYCASHLRRN